MAGIYSFCIMHSLSSLIALSTALHRAMQSSGRIELCRALLRKGADLACLDIEQRTPLHNFFNDTTSEFLLNQKDVLESLELDCYGMSILHHAAWSSQSQPEHFSYFLERQPALYDIPDHKGRCLLHYASERGNVPLVEYLCSVPNVDIALRDAAGRMPMHYAVRSRRVQVIDVLISNGADISSVGAGGWNTIHEAVMRDNVEAIIHVCTLLGSRVDFLLKAIDQQGLTPLALAKKRKAMAALDYLKTHHPIDAQENHESQDNGDMRGPEHSFLSPLERSEPCIRPDTMSWDFRDPAYELYLRGLFAIGFLSVLFIFGNGSVLLKMTPYS
jgi:ankyrin repeat protein